MREELVDFGLSEEEADLFLLCLKTGEVTVNRIAELSNLARSTVYDILQKLINKGLISTTIKKSTTHYIANNPNVLLRFIDDKRYKIERILPQLEQIQN